MKTQWLPVLQSFRKAIAQSKLRDDERGSAMTEFIMCLPVFILIFAGVLDLYKVNQQGLEVKSAAAAVTMADAISIQTTLSGNMDHMNPLSSGISDLIGGNYSGMADAILNGASAGGIYIDSGLKASLADVVLPVSPSPKFTLASIMGTTTAEDGNNLYSYNLLNDLVNFESQAFTSGSFAGITSGILSATGARPGIVAGIRYGAARGEKSKTTNGNFGSYEMGARYTLPAPTMPTHRFFSVAMTRLEFARSNPYDKTIVVFNYEADTSGGDSVPSNEADNCAQGAQNYESCINANATDENGAAQCPGANCPCSLDDYGVTDDCAGGGNPLSGFFGSWDPNNPNGP
ncbi:MAG: pilus assembly protein [Bradymonadaceae bacterium]|nr:pilus assembly protein [Lujinxingiaceae bacterium]